MGFAVGAPQFYRFNRNFDAPSMPYPAWSRKKPVRQLASKKPIPSKSVKHRPSKSPELSKSQYFAFSSFLKSLNGMSCFYARLLSSEPLFFKGLASGLSTSIASVAPLSQTASQPSQNSFE